MLRPIDHGALASKFGFLKQEQCEHEHYLLIGNIWKNKKLYLRLCFYMCMCVHVHMHVYAFVHICLCLNLHTCVCIDMCFFLC